MGYSPQGSGTDIQAQRETRDYAKLQVEYFKRQEKFNRLILAILIATLLATVLVPVFLRFL